MKIQSTIKVASQATTAKTDFIVSDPEKTCYPCWKRQN